MPELKTTREIHEVVKELPEMKQYALGLLCKWNVDHGKDSDMYKLTFKRIDEDFMYPMRWEVFEMRFDTELLYEDHHVEDFIEKVYDYFYTKAKDN